MLPSLRAARARGERKTGLSASPGEFDCPPPAGALRSAREFPSRLVQALVKLLCVHWVGVSGAAGERSERGPRFLQHFGFFRHQPRSLPNEPDVPGWSLQRSPQGSRCLTWATDPFLPGEEPRAGEPLPCCRGEGVLVPPSLCLSHLCCGEAEGHFLDAAVGVCAGAEFGLLLYYRLVEVICSSSEN